jgi:transcriptional regulator with XRE-family HTH domain
MEHYPMRKVRQLRERKGVSLRELARRSGVGVATLSRIESGEANPRMSTLLQLADALGVFVGQLFEKPSGRKGGKSGGTQ